MHECNNVAIDAKKLVKHYNYNSSSFVKAVNGVNLIVNRGEFLYINGPNGSGKTTFLSMIGCMIKPTSGMITILNEEVTSFKQEKLTDYRLKNIGFVFQTFRLIDSLSALENVMLVLNLSGINEAESIETAKHLLEEMQILHRSNFFPQSLSAGEKQRVAIARALANDPSIILADEPTGSLDSVSGKNIIRLLQNIAHKRKKTVVIVSHDERIKPSADRILFMEDGKIFEN